MAGSLLICRELNVSQAELNKIAGGSSLSPGQLLASAGSTEDAQKLAEALKASERRAAEAFEAEKKMKRLSTFIAVGSFLMGAAGLYLSWRSTMKPGEA